MAKKVLIVDDEPGIIEVMQDYIAMSDLDLKVISANSVDEGLALVESDSPDIIVSDIAMPKKTGLDFLKELAVRGKRIPVIIVSGYGDKDMISDAWKLGAFDFLDKPINRKRFIENLAIASMNGEDFIAEKVHIPQMVKVMLDADVFNKANLAAKDAGMPLDLWIASVIKKDMH
jgi:DNA-binding NtrC family response regulator